MVQLLADTGDCVTSYDPHSSSYDTCITSALHSLLLAEFGCTVSSTAVLQRCLDLLQVPWLPDRRQICQLPGESGLALSSYQSNRRNQHNLCPEPCVFTNLYFGPPVTGLPQRPATAELVLYFRKSIKVCQ